MEKVYACFIDSETALVVIDKMIKKLKKIGLRGRLLETITVIYNDTVYDVLAIEGLTRRFRIYREVRQEYS